MPVFNILTPEEKERRRQEEETKRLEEEKLKKEEEERIQREYEEEQRKLKEEQERLEAERQRIEEERIRQEEEERKRQEALELAKQLEAEKITQNSNVQSSNKKNSNKKDKYAGMDYDTRLAKMYKDLKIKKIIFLLIMAVIIIALLVFGTYNTFFKHEKTAAEITAEVNKYNQESGFPDQGVLGFIKQNVNIWVSELTYFDENNGAVTKEVDINSVFLTAITKKSSTIANVFFQATIVTDKGPTTHNFYIPVQFDWDKFAYYPAGQLELAMRGIENGSKVQEGSNKISSFEGIEKDKTNTENAQKFVTDFLDAVYNSPNQSLDTRYKGNYKLGDVNISYKRLLSFTLYQDYNLMGYNAVAEYEVSTSNGLVYKNITYFNLVKSGDSWLINQVL